MREALFYKEKKEKTVQCFLCPKKCIIKQDEKGDCQTRKNVKGKLYSLTYAKPCSISIDPIEKKPLYHFLPGSKTLSLGTFGCNLHCDFCQNWEISQSNPEDYDLEIIQPKAVIKKATETNSRSIAYTYNDPIAFYEYALETSKLAKKQNLKNIIVCNGFINQEPLQEWCKYIDAANIDLKSFDDKFYRRYTTAWLQPVLDSLITLRKNNVWLEITNLIIPQLNDNTKKIKEMCQWIKDNLGKDTPLHFSAFYPCYRLIGLKPTSPETVLKAREIALNAGLNYVYAGNINTDEANNTYCPKSKKLAIERNRFQIINNNIKNDKFDGEKITGVWK